MSQTTTAACSVRGQPSFDWVLSCFPQKNKSRSTLKHESDLISLSDDDEDEDNDDDNDNDTHTTQNNNFNDTQLLQHSQNYTTTTTTAVVNQQQITNNTHNNTTNTGLKNNNPNIQIKGAEASPRVDVTSLCRNTFLHLDTASPLARLSQSQLLESFRNFSTKLSLSHSATTTSPTTTITTTSPVQTLLGTADDTSESLASSGVKSPLADLSKREFDAVWKDDEQDEQEKVSMLQMDFAMNALNDQAEKEDHNNHDPLNQSTITTTTEKSSSSRCRLPSYALETHIYASSRFTDNDDGTFRRALALDATPTPNEYMDSLFTNLRREGQTHADDQAFMETIEPIFRLISNTNTMIPNNPLLCGGTGGSGSGSFSQEHEKTEQMISAAGSAETSLPPIVSQLHQMSQVFDKDEANDLANILLEGNESLIDPPPRQPAAQPRLDWMIRGSTCSPQLFTPPPLSFGRRLSGEDLNATAEEFDLEDWISGLCEIERNDVDEEGEEDIVVADNDDPMGIRNSNNNDVAFCTKGYYRGNLCDLISDYDQVANLTNIFVCTIAQTLLQAPPPVAKLNSATKSTESEDNNNNTADDGGSVNQAESVEEGKTSEMADGTGATTAATVAQGGLAGHPTLCKPCAFYWSKGCMNGDKCQFCHLWHVPKKKKPMKEQKNLMIIARDDGKIAFLRCAIEDALRG